MTEPEVRVRASPPAGFVADALTRGFLFCDLRGYTAFVEARGDRAAAELLEDYRELIRAAIAATGGGEIRTEGDSFYVVFASASAAVRCGLAIVHRAADASARNPDRPVRVGVGIHAGESVEGREGYVGSAVNIAARVCSLAEPGEVLITDTVRSLVRTSLPLTVRPRGHPRLKGIAEPIPLFAVTERGATPAAAPARISTRAKGTLVAFGLLGAAGIAVVAWAVVQGGPVRSSGSAPSDTPSAGAVVASNEPRTAGPSGAATDASSSAALPGQVVFLALQTVGPAPGFRQQVYVADPDGSNRRRITPLTENVDSYVVSPDETRIVYSPVRSGDDPGIPPRVVTISGSAQPTTWPGTWRGATLILAETGPQASTGTKAGRPNEHLIDVVYDWSRRDELLVQSDFANYRLSADGRTLAPIALSGASVDGSPADQPLVVSPDGQSVAFVHTTASGSTDIWIAPLDGSGLIQVTQDVDAAAPAWSPDGNRIAFVGRSRVNGQSDIWVVNVEGTGQKPLTDDVDTDHDPTWSPDGQWIAWGRTVGAQRQIWGMQQDGSRQHRLFAGADGEQLDRPTWIGNAP